MHLVYSAPFAVAGLAHLFLFLLLLISGRARPVKFLFLFATASTAIAGATIAVGSADVVGVAGAILELAVTGSWCGVVIWLLYEQQTRDGHVVQLISAAALIAAIASIGSSAFPGNAASTATIELYSRVALAVVGLLATENFFRNTDAEARWRIIFFCIALAGMFAYTIFLYADALLFRRVSALLWAGRGVVVACAAPFFAVAAARNRDWAINIHVSRDAVFHTATLLGSGVFLLALAATGEAFRAIGPGWGDLAEMLLAIGGVTVLGVVLSSGSARSRLRRIVADNFYSTRYDYRREWLKCIEVLSGGRKPDSVQTRVIRAVAEVVDSPRGMLWVRELESAAFGWAGSWNQPATGRVEPADSPFAGLFREGDWIVEFGDDLGAEWPAPEWLGEVKDPWLAVPLPHNGRVIGFVVLSRPRAPLKLDNEVFDLLRIVARQSAIHLAEQRNAKALAETKQLGDFAKRFAFVAHDVKNVGGQLAMVLHNARSHSDDPQFHQDVLLTVQAAHDRIRKLLGGLTSTASPTPPGVIFPVELLTEIVEEISRSRGNGTITLQLDGRNAPVSMDKNDFYSVIKHLCDNAIEASAGGVQLRVRHQAMRVAIEVADCGQGMSAEFIRDQLFQPFGSTKRQGMGIGAYQARELVRAAGGDLLVASKPGMGTTIRIFLPNLGALDENGEIKAGLEGIQ